MIKFLTVLSVMLAWVCTPSALVSADTYATIANSPSYAASRKRALYKFQQRQIEAIDMSSSYVPIGGDSMKGRSSSYRSSRNSTSSSYRRSRGGSRYSTSSYRGGYRGGSSYGYRGAES